MLQPIQHSEDKESFVTAGTAKSGERELCYSRYSEQKESCVTAGTVRSKRAVLQPVQ